MLKDKDTFIKSIADVIRGWNEKLELTDDELALMVPFCDLYAIYTGSDELTDSGSKRLIDSGFEVQLKDYSGKTETVTLVPVFNLLDQQASVDQITGKLLSPRGIGGIESCSVKTYDVNLGAFQVTLDVEVPSFDEDVRTNKAVRKLCIPGTDWIISYGWGRGATNEQAPIINKVIDLTSSNRGYYRFLKCNLQRFNWKINSNRIVSGTLEFWPYHKAAGLLATAKVHRGTITDLLTNETELMRQCPIEIKSQLPASVSLSKKRTIIERNGTGKKKTQKEEVGYYYLGWILEAMRQAMEDSNKPKFIKMLIFEDWTDTKKSKVMTNADGEKSPIATSFSSPAEVPISTRDLHGEILDLSTNETLLWCMDKVCWLANRQLLGAAELFVELEADGTSIAIRDANDLAFNVANRVESMKIAISSPNSLVSDFELGSRAPVDLTWSFNYFVNTDEGATILYNMYEKEAASSKKDWEISETAQMIRKFNRSTVGDKKALDANRLSNWKSYLQVNAKDKIEQIAQEVSSSQTVPIGLALRNFFKTVTVTIHGTAMVPPGTQLDVRGILPGIDGRYQVFQLTDSLTPGSFTSELEASLLLPY